MPIQQILLGGASPLTADVAPTLVTGHSATFPATVTSSSCTVTASGGTGSYTYEWEYVSGATLEYVSPISSSTQAWRTLISNNSQRIGFYRCKVSDGVSTVYTSTVEVRLSAGNPL